MCECVRVDVRVRCCLSLPQALDMFLTMGSADSLARDPGVSFTVALVFLVVGWVNAVVMIYTPYLYARVVGEQGRLAMLHASIMVADLCSDMVLVFITIIFRLYESSGFALTQMVVGILMCVKSIVLFFTPWVFSKCCSCAPDFEDDDTNNGDGNPAGTGGNAAT